MSANPFARPPACPVCHDVRKLTRSVRAYETDLIPCHACGTMPDDEYEQFRRDAWVKSHAAPTICELDLTPEEYVSFKRLRDEHPKVAKLTVLSWIEGQRYDPSKDEEFLVEAREEFRKWREARDKADAEYRATHPYSAGDGRIRKGP